MSQKDDCKDPVQTAELTDLTPTTEETEETKAGTQSFLAHNAYLGAITVAGGDI